jgi:chemotaxis protein histidine kinase CheA
MIKDDDLEAMLEPIRLEFIASLPERYAHFDALWQKVTDGTASQDDLIELRRGLHTLTGCGLTFGLPAISEAARPMEHHLDPICQAHRLPDAAEQAEFVSLMQALRAVDAAL